MHISKIILENFQAFEKGEFDLSPNLNILVGVSNVGKSSIARALSLVLFNKWDKSWTKFGAKYCRVTVQTNTGIEVVREKGEKINRYILRLPGQVEQLYESFGVNTPEAVQQALRIHEVQIDATDSLNLQLASQMDSLFLLSQTGSYRAKVLGKLSGATYLDHSIRSLNTEKRQTTAEKSSKDLELAELQTQLDRLTPIEAYKDQISEIEAKFTALSAQEARLERIRGLSSRVKALKASWERQTAIEALIGQIDTSKIAELGLKVDKIKVLGLLMSKFTDLRSVSERQNKLKALLSKIDPTAIPTLTEKTSRLKQIRDLYNKINKNQNELVSKTDELGQVEQKYNETKEQYSVMLKNAGICPICGTSTMEMEICK